MRPVSPSRRTPLAAAALCATLVLAGSPATAGPRWGGAVALGTAWNVPLPLVVRQSGADDLRLRARYETRAFRFPLYYRVRVERADDAGGWALSLTHHKVHLANRPPEVGEFAVSHGFNLLVVERSWRDGRRTHALGAGLVVAHPENTVRGRALPQRGGPFRAGYYVTGPALALGLGHEVPLGGRWVMPFEARATAAWARVPVVDGHADAPNVALHGTVGLGRR